MLIKENRAIVKEKITSQAGLMHDALSAMCLSSKNIYNTALYHIHNAFLLNNADFSNALIEHSQTALILQAIKAQFIQALALTHACVRLKSS